MVSERCENQSKSVEQCKNKVDNLKKRYKLERHRLSNGGVSTSHWPWFKQMEQIVGNSIAAKAAAEEEKSSGVAGASYSTRQTKRYTFEYYSAFQSLQRAISNQLLHYLNLWLEFEHFYLIYQGFTSFVL